MRTTPSAITVLTILLFSALSVCQKADDGWVTKGTIQMDKLISLDSLWERREERRGEIVTLELGPSSSVGVGTTGKIEGINYHDVCISLKMAGVESGWGNIKEYLHNNHVAYEEGDTLWLGKYRVSVINEGKLTGKIPEWTNYKKGFIQFDRRAEIIPMAKSTNKIITGILLGNDKEYQGNHAGFKALLEARVLTIFPLGIRYRIKN